MMSQGTFRQGKEQGTWLLRKENKIIREITFNQGQIITFTDLTTNLTAISDMPNQFKKTKQ